MLLLDAIVALVAIACGTGVAKMLIDKLGDGRAEPLREELRLARDRIALLEQRNEHLAQQVEWHTRFLGTIEGLHGAAKGEESPRLPEKPLNGRPDQRQSVADESQTT